MPRKTAFPTDAHATATMRANRGRDTGPELLLRSALHRAGLRFRKNLRIDLPDARVRPDVAFPRIKLAIFVDGCFWHGCASHRSIPQANATFWTEKIAANRRRDEVHSRLLEDSGWVVLRIWEHDLPDPGVHYVVAAAHALYAATGVGKPR